MLRENTFTDPEERSLTPDLEDGVNPFPPASPNYASSIRSRTAGLGSSAPKSLHPKDRFRDIVRKVIALHRGLNLLSCRGPGAEPGVNPRHPSADAEYGEIKQECVIELVDYSAVRSNFRRMSNHQFVDLMATESVLQPWVKVRWINIGGMSWDVMKALSIKYSLHPLALEDVFHARPTARSKADYYVQHLFLRILCHELDDGGQDSILTIPPSYATISESFDDENTLHSSVHSPLLQKLHSVRHAAAAANEQRRIQDATLQALKSDERVNVNVAPMFIFLFRDGRSGTVISIHSKPNLEITEPITSRVRQFDSILRTSADASLLVQSLLGLVTDKALEVVNAYQDKIKKFERNVMVRPTINTVRNLHVLSADLILHRRTLAPIKTLVYGLRRYDIDRSTAVVDVSTSENGIRVAGFMSHKTLIYLADVHDQMEYVLSQLDVIAGIGQNLVDYTFNMTSYQMNEVMRRLMLVTVIFLPLTSLTGYFGMNFTFMWSTKHDHSDWIYWAIALPIMCIVLPLFLAPDMQRMAHYVQKQMLTKKVVKSFNG
ncbi:hypothetical protein K438DRAFT_1676097 [Mycena galopus ATCC 62051]|nr:hypothetical protein K438DRAFT_1676097 [Mycena galopus ATCC 62051]